MNFLNSHTSFSRFRIIDDEFPNNLSSKLSEVLSQFSFQNTLATATLTQEKIYGWTLFEDLKPNLGKYMTFSLRLDIKTIHSAVLKQYINLALNVEKAPISKERRREIKEQVNLKQSCHHCPFRSQL